jgi:hypothetical protein
LILPRKICSMVSSFMSVSQKDSVITFEFFCLPASYLLSFSFELFYLQPPAFSFEPSALSFELHFSPHLPSFHSALCFNFPLSQFPIPRPPRFPASTLSDFWFSPSHLLFFFIPNSAFHCFPLSIFSHCRLFNFSANSCTYLLLNDGQIVS